MNRRYLPYLIIGAVVLLLSVGVYYLKSIMPKYNWTEQLRTSNKQPYGLSIFYNIIKETVGENNFHEIEYNNFEKAFSENPNAGYIYIGTNYFIDSIDIYKIIKHVEKGNNAFIASTHNKTQFIKVWLNHNELDEKPLFETINEDSITITDLETDSCYQFHHQFQKKTINYEWNYLTSDFILDHSNKINIHSNINDTKPVFVSIPVGKGTIFLHSTPILLSNYYLSQEKYFTYLQSVWNTIATEEVVWDNSSATFYNKSSFSHLKGSPLRFILNHKNLRWAWFTLLAAVLIFVISESKRKQRAIPALPKKENITLEYAKAISSLYFQSKSHKAISIEMMNQLYSFIKARYSIKLGNEKLKEVPRLAKASGIEPKKLENLFKLEIKLTYDKHAEAEQLYTLYNLIDDFYKNCN